MIQTKKQHNQYAAINGPSELTPHDCVSHFHVCMWHMLSQYDDAKLQRVHDEYSSGRMLSGEIKMELVNCITPMVLAHQRARAAVSDETVRTFMSMRKMQA